jgi:hypothetical protein
MRYGEHWAEQHRAPHPPRRSKRRHQRHVSIPSPLTHVTALRRLNGNDGRRRGRRVRNGHNEMPSAHEKAQFGLWLIEDAIVDLLWKKSDWVRHSEIQDELGLRSTYRGKHGGYLSGTILERLVDRGVIDREGEGQGVETRFRLRPRT